MNTERSWNYADRSESKYLKKKLCQCYLFHQKYISSLSWTCALIRVGG